MRALPSRLLVITDRHQAKLPVEEIADRIFAAGAKWLLFRDRDMEAADRAALASALAATARRRGAFLSIGGDIELAERVEADGVHLQSPDAVIEARARFGMRRLIGFSAHSLADVMSARAARADYVSLSPIFPTPSKPGYGPPLGPEAIRQAADLSIPIVALGGITDQNTTACLVAGAAAVAVMGEVMRAERPEEVATALARAFSSEAGTGSR